MSHSREEEEVEDIQCIEDHLQILQTHIDTMRAYLSSSQNLSKTKTKQMLTNTLEEATGIVKRLKYMLEDG